eukprot:TRINITY_DN72277_c0_g1_i1.p1 TRINITY_DN72277_c0_g1~~TRINITY_DN72277_c0_g1_i1.p1  ORF type:complete len:239 (+),score=31.36 TRINITY_DN72277_c0_g1_i1:49-717(+)
MAWRPAGRAVRPALAAGGAALRLRPSAAARGAPTTTTRIAPSLAPVRWWLSPCPLAARAHSGVRGLASTSAAPSERSVRDLREEERDGRPDGAAFDVDEEQVRQTARHPKMASLEIHSSKGEAHLRRREVCVKMPLKELREKLQGWGWEGDNAERPILLFGDDDHEVQRAHLLLTEEGFTSVTNARSRDAVVRALKRPPAHLREAAPRGGRQASAAPSEGAN